VYGCCQQYWCIWEGVGDVSCELLLTIYTSCITDKPVWNVFGTNCRTLSRLHIPATSFFVQSSEVCLFSRSFFDLQCLWSDLCHDRKLYSLLLLTQYLKAHLPVCLTIAPSPVPLQLKITQHCTRFSLLLMLSVLLLLYCRCSIECILPWAHFLPTYSTKVRFRTAWRQPSAPSRRWTFRGHLPTSRCFSTWPPARRRSRVRGRRIWTGRRRRTWRRSWRGSCDRGWSPTRLESLRRTRVSAPISCSTWLSTELFMPNSTRSLPLKVTSVHVIHCIDVSTIQEMHLNQPVPSFLQLLTADVKTAEALFERC